MENENAIDKKANKLFIFLIVAVTIIAFGFLIKKIFYSKDADKPLVTPDKIAEEQKKYENKVEKYKEGYYETVDGQVLETGEGWLTLESYRYEEPRAFKILLDGEVKVEEIILTEEKADESQEAGIVNQEIKKGSLRDIKTGMLIEVMADEMFNYQEASEIRAAKISIYEQLKE